MTLTAELYTAAAGDRLRSATEKSVEVWKQGAQGPHRPRRHGPPAADRRPHPRRRAVLRVRAEDRRRPTGNRHPLGGAADLAQRHHPRTDREGPTWSPSRPTGSATWSPGRPRRPSKSPTSRPTGRG